MRSIPSIMAVGVSGFAACITGTAAQALAPCPADGFHIQASERVAAGQYLLTADVEIDPIIKTGGVLVLCPAARALVVVPRGEAEGGTGFAELIRPYLVSSTSFTLAQLSDALTDEARIAYLRPVASTLCGCLGGND